MDVALEQRMIGCYHNIYDLFGSLTSSESVSVTEVII